jgi:hypothetical protein
VVVAWINRIVSDQCAPALFGPESVNGLDDPASEVHCGRAAAINKGEVMNRRRFFQLMLGGALTTFGSGLTACAVYRPYPRNPHYNYYYYPDVDVYFHIYTGYYYYVVDHVWVRSRTLPHYIYLSPAQRRTLSIHDAHPYTRNRAHRRQFGLPDVDPNVVRERERKIKRENDRTRQRAPATTPDETRPSTPAPRQIPPGQAGRKSHPVAPVEPRLRRSERETENRRERDNLERESVWRRRQGT